MRKAFFRALILDRDTFLFKGKQYIVIDERTAYQYDSDTVYYKDIDSKHNILGCKDADAKHNNLYCKAIGVIVNTCINDNANACRSSCDFYGFYQ